MDTQNEIDGLEAQIKQADFQLNQEKKIAELKAKLETLKPAPVQKVGGFVWRKEYGTPVMCIGVGLVILFGTGNLLAACIVSVGLFLLMSGKIGMKESGKGEPKKEISFQLPDMGKMAGMKEVKP